jgi:signal transduction histidine kinase/ActR/RegA family two-component response regulator
VPAAIVSRARVARRITLALGAYALAGGLTSFLGWALDLRRLTDWYDYGISIQPNAALAVACSGAALLLLAADWRGAARALGAVVTLIGGATLFEWLSGAELGIDGLLLFDRHWGRVGVLVPGRMGPPGSLSWTLIGTALMLASHPRGAGRAASRRVAAGLAVFSLCLAFTSLVAYLYGADVLYTVPRLTVIALQTATFIAAVSAGLIAAVPERQPMRGLLEDTAAGTLARRALGIIVVLPVALGWLRVTGQNAGLFDMPFGTTLRTVTEILLLAALLGWALGEVRSREQALREDDRRKDEFLATLAHELRNPLAPVWNAVDILRRKNATAPESQRARDVIERQLRQMTRLVDDLLDVSRIRHGTIELKRGPVLLTDLVQTAVETSRPLIDGHGQELTVELPDEPVYLEADATRLGQVFSNLLNNAAKFTPHGGRIALTARRESGEIVVSVLDSGRGIPAGMMSRVFEMFTQVDRSLEKSQGGLGVGLTIAKQLVELHGGRIEGRSEGAGKGSEFAVRLPVLAAPPAAPLANRREEPRVAAPSHRVLIVDDNEDAAQSLEMILRIVGHDVRTAHDGPQAVLAAREFQPRVVLLDIGLPQMNGYDVARQIRQQPWSAGTVLIAVTGWGQEEDRRRSNEAGFDHHLVKPVAPDVIMDLLASVRAPAPDA